MKIIAVHDINYKGVIIRAGKEFDCDKETAIRLVKNGSAKKKRQTKTSKAKAKKV